jgi:glycosyltransferase involved in cell wall biosynthesis
MKKLKDSEIRLLKKSSFSLSIVVFTYNSSDIIEKSMKCIERSISDALSQYEMFNYEVLIVDNNSIDKTLCVVEEFILDRENWKLTNNSVQGLLYSRKKSIELCSGDYLVFVDDDNMITSTYITKALDILNAYSVDILGGRSYEILEGDYPYWWEKYKGYYACGRRYSKDGFLNNPLNKMWGAGLIVLRSKLLEIFQSEFLCIGRQGLIQTSGDDSELNYKLRLTGSKFYYSNQLVLGHYMRSRRLNIEFMKKTFEGNAAGSIYLDCYKYALTKNPIYDVRVLSIFHILISPFLSIAYGINYFKYSYLRIKMLGTLLKYQKQIYQYSFKKP